jgi:hypothetical protein
MPANFRSQSTFHAARRANPLKLPRYPYGNFSLPQR